MRKNQSVVVCCFCFEVLQIFKKKKEKNQNNPPAQNKNLSSETEEPSFTNKLLPRHRCTGLPRARNSGCRRGPHDGPSGWRAETSSQNVIPKSSSSVSCIWDLEVAMQPLISCQQWEISLAVTLRRGLCARLLCCEVLFFFFYFKIISSLCCGELFWMEVPPYCGIKMKPHLFKRNESPW